MKDPDHEAATFATLPEGRATVVGALDFWTVTALLPVGAEAIRQGQAAAIDLAGVTAGDSAGLALLIEWLSIAHAASRRLRFENIPSQLHQLADLSDVDGLIAAA
jgi:phospholipid transport system transporter-binding protein